MLLIESPDPHLPGKFNHIASPDLQLTWTDVQATDGTVVIGWSHCFHVLLLGSFESSGVPPFSYMNSQCTHLLSPVLSPHLSGAVPAHVEALLAAW